MLTVKIQKAPPFGGAGTAQAVTERVLLFVSQNSLQVFPHTGHRCNVGALVGGVDVQQVRAEGDAVQPVDLAGEDAV